MKDYDSTIAFVGHWGWFQRLFFFLLGVSMVPNGLVSFYIVFVADTPSHHCLVPEVNLTQGWRNNTIPNEVVHGKPQLSRCRRYRLDVVKNLSDQGLIPGRDVNLTDLEQEGCLDGWSYSKDIYQSTIVTDFNLVCSEEWKQPFSSTVYLLGLLSGNLLAGPLSDRFGRKPIFFIASGIQSLSTIIQIFSPAWTFFAIFFFLTGVGRISNYLCAFVLASEILTGKVRVLFTSFGICGSFTVGYMLLPLFAYFIRDWKYLLFALTVPNIMILFLWWFIPESPRWLVSQGRVAEAEAILKKVAKMNKIEAPQIIFEDYHTLADEKKTSHKKHNVLDLIKTQNIRNVTLIVCLVWFTLRTGYYALSLNTSQLHADPFISCFMSAAIEIPAYILGWLALQYLRRRPTTICVFIIGALAMFCIQLVPENMSPLAVALELLGKGTFTGGVCLLYVYSAEIFPTVLRTTATGTTSILSRVGSSLAPFLFKLSVYFEYLPYILLASLTLVSGLSALFLPETFEKHLPQTIEEMPNIQSQVCPIKPRKKDSSSNVVTESRL